MEHLKKVLVVALGVVVAQIILAKLPEKLKASLLS